MKRLVKLYSGTGTAINVTDRAVGAVNKIPGDWSWRHYRILFLRRHGETNIIHNLEMSENK